MGVARVVENGIQGLEIARIRFFKMITKVLMSQWSSYIALC
jgi:hypothetical protein